MHTARQLLDQVEQAAIGPVDVLEHEHRRLLDGDRLDEAAHGEEQRLAILGQHLRLEAEDEPEMRRHHLRLGHREAVALGCAASAGRQRARRSRRCPRTVSPARRTRRRRCSRGRAGSGRARCGRRRRPRYDGTSDAEPRLAYAGRSEHRHEMRAAGCGALPDALEHRQLADAADQRRARADVVGARRRSASHTSTGASLPFAITGSARAYTTTWFVQRYVSSADQHAARRRSRLEARGRVDDVASDHRLAHFGPCANGHQRLAGVDRDAHLRAQSALRTDRAARTARSGSSP